MTRLRKFLPACLILSGVLLAAPVLADGAKKTVPTPGWENNPTVGVFGAHPQHAGGGAPPPAVAAAPLPQVQVESTMSGSSSLTAAPSLPGAPRPDVRPEGGGSHAASQPGLPPLLPQPQPLAPPPSGYLPSHPFASGLVAGLVGTDLGEKLYGGTMSGSQQAAVIGFGLRVLLLVLGMAGLVRLLWGVIGGTTAAPRLTGRRRREPSFQRDLRSDGGTRREPTLH